MNVRVVDGRRRSEEGTEVLDLLAASDSPVVATDMAGHVVFWNRAAERSLGRPAAQVLGRRCYDVMGGRDVFGNRFCHENCSVVSMSRKGEPVQGFELAVGIPSRPEQPYNVTVLRVPGARADSFTLVHILQPIDGAARLARALERLGAQRQPVGPAEGWEPRSVPGPVAVPRTPPLTDREGEILRWVAAGLQNKEVAQQLGISLATVRNHIHNVLEKLDVHSKLEAVSLAFRLGWVVSAAADAADTPDTTDTEDAG
jgi:DNA-binding CsgD family transcriptional regulator